MLHHQVPAASRRYGLSTLLPQPLQPTEGLVLQYEVQFSEGHTCGGAYIKLLPADPAFQPAQLSPKTPYTIMFGPDRCGPHSRVRTEPLAACAPVSHVSLMGKELQVAAVVSPSALCTTCCSLKGCHLL
jgi:hypothetical protein